MGIVVELARWYDGVMLFDRRRYLLFAGRNLSPHGGWRDFVDGFEGLEQALNVGEGLIRQSKHKAIRWYHVVDRKTLKIVAQGGQHAMGPARIDI